MMLLILIVVGLVFTVNSASAHEQKPDVTPELEPSSAPEPTPEPTPTAVPTPTQTPVPTPESTPEPEYDYTTGTGTPLFDYKCGDPVPESESVDDTFFADTVFIGNSRTQGFMYYSGLKGSHFLAGKSISVSNIKFEKVIPAGEDTYVSILDALSWQQYKKVYVMLGINEIGLEFDEFYNEYSSLIDSIRIRQPDAEIYVESIIPVSKSKSENGGLYNNYRVRKFNEQLAALCSDKGLHYVDVYTGLVNEDGNLPDDASSDGVHLNMSFCVTWLDYLKSHTVLTKEMALAAEENMIS